VERIQNLTKVLELTVPNAFLADALLKAAHEERDATEKAPTHGTPVDRASPKAFGTGWVVWGDYVVTNNHVVAGATGVRKPKSPTA
jgi:S1-C subfamily serine protease